MSALNPEAYDVAVGEFDAYLAAPFPRVVPAQIAALVQPATTTSSGQAVSPERAADIRARAAAFAAAGGELR